MTRQRGNTLWKGKSPSAVRGTSSIRPSWSATPRFGPLPPCGQAPYIPSLQGACLAEVKIVRRSFGWRDRWTRFRADPPQAGSRVLESWPSLHPLPVSPGCPSVRSQCLTYRVTRGNHGYPSAHSVMNMGEHFSRGYAKTLLWALGRQVLRHVRDAAALCFGMGERWRASPAPTSPGIRSPRSGFPQPRLRSGINAETDLRDPSVRLRC